MALSANTPRNYEPFGTDITDLPIKASTTIYEGGAVGIDAASGYARPLTAGDTFKGFALEKQSAVANGDTNIRVRFKGAVVLAIAALAITDVDKPVYASDDGTFTLTASTNSYIGKVHRWISTGVGLVTFDCQDGAAIAALTDSTGGVVDGTLADVGGAFNQATLNANFADLAAKVNALIKLVK